MKIVSYNINGIRAGAKLGLIEWIKDYDADVYCIQEVRASKEITTQILNETQSQLNLFENSSNSLLHSYNATYNCGEVAGYAGTLILSKQKPDIVFYNMGEFWQDNEGRTTTVIFNDLAIIDAYIPNGNSRLEFKMQYLDALTKYIQHLKQKYSVICVGDFNIAHNEIDLTNPKECKNKSVFLPIERKAFSDILNVGMVDTFRELNPNSVIYSWRSYRSRKDVNHKGYKYRIDYILASENLKEKLQFADILDLEYSDHLACVLEINNQKI